MLNQNPFPNQYKSSRRTFLLRGTSAALVGVAAPALRAQTAVRMVIPYPVGGSSDALARLVVDGLHQVSDQTYVIDSKPGAAGKLGMGIVMNSKPDGKTLLTTTSSSFTVVPHTAKDPKERGIPNMEPVGALSLVDFALFVKPDFPASTFAEYVAAVRRDSALASFGTSGLGNISHFCGLMLAKAANIMIRDVPFQGGGPAMLSVMGGHTPAAVGSIGTPLVQAHNSGRIRILATLGARRNPFIPAVPTMTELNYPDVAFSDWLAVYAPAGTPQQVIQTLSAQIAKVVVQPQYIARLATSGYEPLVAGPAACAERMRKEYKFWEPIVRASGFTA